MIRVMYNATKNYDNNYHLYSLAVLHVRNFRNSLLVTLFGLFISMSVWASTNYAPLIEDIEQRLDKTAEHQQQHADEARRTVQNGYFEVFEAGRGPITSNISAPKLRDGERIRRDPSNDWRKNRSLTSQARIDWLKAQWNRCWMADIVWWRRAAQRVIGDDIAVHWQESFRTIDDLLARAVTEYQAGNYSVASQHVQQAHYQGL